MNRRAVLFAAGSAVASLFSCGYHVGGKADLVPKSIQTISIPAFSTMTTRYRLVDVLPQQIGREFMARTRFRVVNDPSQADAVLNGTINAVVESPYVFDPTTGKATGVQVVVWLNLKLIERTTGRVLYSNPNLGTRGAYQVAVDPHQYFDERDTAFARLSSELAQKIVSLIIDNF